jgi:hypothetical protein
VKGKPYLERVGLGYFQKRSKRLPAASSTDAVHELNAEERKGMRRVAAGAVTRASLAGAISGAISAAAEVLASPLVPEGASLFSRESLTFWAIVGGATLIATVLEIGFVYWDTLRSVHDLSRTAGLKLFAPEKDSDAVAEALARAALELPDPVDVAEGVNPHRLASRWRLLFASLVYKAKIGVTNFIFKALVRRVLGRALARSALNTLVPFVAVPVTAAWNGLVTWKVLREARLRAMGPSAVHALCDVVYGDVPRLSPAGKLATVRAVAAAIVQTESLHPNLHALLQDVQLRAGDTGKNELDDPQAFLKQLPSLEQKEQRLAVQVLAVACIVDGKLGKKERLMLERALAACGRAIELEKVESLRKAFVEGEGLDDEAVRAL